MELAVWAVAAVLGTIPTVGALWKAIRDYRAFGQYRRDAVALMDFVKEELIRELIIFGGQVLTVVVAVVSYLYDREVWEHSVIVWMLIPLPMLLGLLSYHSVYARRRAERRLSR